MFSPSSTSTVFTTIAMRLVIACSFIVGAIPLVAQNRESASDQRIYPDALKNTIGPVSRDALSVHLPVKALSIFKNGTCYITKEGRVPVKNSEVRLAVPNAINATYWITASGDKIIRSIRYSDENIKVSREIGSMLDLLEANVGKSISFDLRREGGAAANASAAVQSISGKIVGINHAMNSFKVEVNGAVRLFGVDAIAPNTSIIQGLADEKMTDSTARQAIITTTKPINELTLREVSLQRNVQWIPSYAVHIMNDKELRIEMKALIENFSNEDISDADAEIVVGVPQLYYSYLNDPTASSSYTQQQNGTVYKAVSPAYYSNSVGSAARLSLDVANDVQGNANTWGGGFGDQAMYGSETEQVRDNFVYKLGSVSLPKNSKTGYAVFATTLPYKDELECDIPDVLNYENSRSVATPITEAEVFHSIELDNKGIYPLTTGGVLVEDESGHFLSQDEIKYTPIGGKGKIHLAKSLSVGVKHSEEEMSRADNVKKIGRQNYGRAVIHGTITVVNYDTKSQHVVLRKVLNGTVVKSDGGKTHRNANVGGTNPNTSCEWTVDLPAGQSQEINYEYECLYRQ